MKHPEVISSEGGHSDFAVVDDEDADLLRFAKDFIETSDNVENLRGKGKINRVSTERLCAGPAVPLLYKFFKERCPETKSSLADTIPFDKMIAKDIIAAGMAEGEARDPICRMVVKKFVQILARLSGNIALSVLPAGGIYICGGVTYGVFDYLCKESDFIHEFENKGRLASVCRRTAVKIVNPNIELGILGAEECAFRSLENI